VEEGNRKPPEGNAMKFSEMLQYAMIPTSLSLSGSALADNCTGHYSQVAMHSQSFDLGGGHKIDMFMTKTTTIAGKLGEMR
jgi:hypothetical protein